MKRPASNPTHEQYDETAFNFQEIEAKQKRLQLFFNSCLSCNLKIQSYQQIKVNDTQYQTGDFVSIHTIKQNEFFIAKLTGIIKLPNQFCQLPFLEVEWALQKQHLPFQIKQKYQKYLSTSEIFPSSKKFYIYCDSLNKKIDVLKEEEFQNLTANHNCLFTRANFDISTFKIMPQPEKWKKICSCQSPCNPDLLYIQCDLCKQWFHEECISYSKEKENEEIYCANCLKKRISEMEMLKSDR